MALSFWTQPTAQLDRLREGSGSERYYRRQWATALGRLKELIESGRAPDRVVVAGGDRCPRDIDRRNLGELPTNPGLVRVAGTGMGTAFSVRPGGGPGVGRWISVAHMISNASGGSLPRAQLWSVLDLFRIQRGSTRAILRFVRRYGFTVRAGPFAGLTYPRSAVLQMPSFTSRLAGTYESELHPVIETLVRSQPRLLINLGAGDGYYAVG